MNKDIKTVFWQTLSARKRSLVVYAIVGLLLMWMFIAFYPSILADSAQFNELLQSYPESLTAILGIDEINFSTLENFLALENFSIMWPVIAIVMLAGIAGSSVAGEIEEGTIELIISRPISRIDLFLGRYFAGVASLIVFIVFSILSVFPLAALHGLETQFTNHLSASFMALLFGLSVLSLTFLFSVIFSEKSKVYYTSGGILGLMYILSGVSNLTENVSFLKYFSFFHYFGGVEALMNNEISVLSIIVFAVFILASTALAIQHFNHRDIAV